MVKYDRILIKVSGEALSAGSGIDANSLARTADTIK